MLKWPITYTDYNGNTRTENFYFNITKAELMEMNFGAFGAYSELIERIAETEDIRAIANEFKTLILKAYGEKSLDGKTFIKKDPSRGRLADEFEQTEAYSELYMELLNDPDKASQFIVGILPQDLQVEAKKNAESFKLAD